MTGFAQGTVFGGLDFGLDPFVDLTVVTGGIEALSRAVGLYDLFARIR